MKKLFPFALILITLIAISGIASSQKVTSHDSSFYKTYPNLFMGRVYFTQKYDNLTFRSLDNGSDLKYSTNGKLGFGIGATYKNLTLNIAYGFNFLNNSKDRGKTSGFDFQLHIFPNKWAIDAALTAYKGAYILPKGYGAANDNSYYYRNDVKMDLFGLSAYRVTNSKRFSYRAAMVQNEWQRKSAGTLLYGGGIYYGLTKGDSSLVPAKIADELPQAGINNIHFITVGPGIGYAYTAVIAQHFFVTASLVGNLNINFTTERNSEASTNKISMEPMGIYKGAIGYNGNVWSVAAIIGGNALLFKGSSSDNAYFQSTGQYKLFIAKKILLKPAKK